MRRILVLLAASVFLCTLSYAQDDAPSLGDVARQARAQKQQKDSQAKDSAAKSSPNSPSADASSPKDASQPKTAHVITNEELPEHVAAKSASSHPSDPVQHSESKEAGSDQPTGDRDAQAEQWKSQILAQKESIAALQHQIAEVTDSIHYVGGNCVQNCEQWNEHQQQKQQQVDNMKVELEEQQKHLEGMQDAARKQGFGTSVYEPEPDNVNQQ